MTEPIQTRVQVHLHPTLKNPPKDYRGLTQIHDIIGQNVRMSLATMIFGIAVELSDFYYRTGQCTVEEINEQIGIAGEQIFRLKGSFRHSEMKDDGQDNKSSDQES